MSALNSIELSSGWEFKNATDASASWEPVERVPTEVHIDLLNKGDIADPFINLNELSVCFVGQ